MQILILSSRTPRLFWSWRNKVGAQSAHGRCLKAPWLGVICLLLAISMSSLYLSTLCSLAISFSRKGMQEYNGSLTLPLVMILLVNSHFFWSTASD